jgi:hypothetical protein
MQLRKAEGEQVLALAGHGQVKPPNHCLSRGGLPSRQREAVVGEPDSRILGAGDILYGSI